MTMRRRMQRMRRRRVSQQHHWQNPFHWHWQTLTVRRRRQQSSLSGLVVGGRVSRPSMLRSQTRAQWLLQPLQDQ